MKPLDDDVSVNMPPGDVQNILSLKDIPEQCVPFGKTLVVNVKDPGVFLCIPPGNFTKPLPEGLVLPKKYRCTPNTNDQSVLMVYFDLPKLKFFFLKILVKSKCS